MNSSVKIPRLRRNYNKWVVNETLEDYALRFTAYKARRFSSWRIANTAIGAISFLALEAIGGSITLNYGFSNAMPAIVLTALIIFSMGVPISYYSAKFGVDIDLLSRGAGFGYIGSTITSLIYASFTFIFFAIEAAIVASALELCLAIPLPIAYIISALAVVPLVTHGVTFINRFQAWTQPFWIVLQLAPFIFVAVNSMDSVRQWTGYTGLHGATGGGFDIGLFGAASAVLFSLTAQIGEQVDYLRFLPRKNRRNRRQWWGALLFAGPGWILIGALKILGGSFLAFYAFQRGVPFELSSEPTRMYLTVFREMLSSPEFALGVTGIFVVICQFKINVTNSYAGSIAWSNFFSRLTHSHPGRVVWLVFNVLIGLLLMEIGVYKALEQTLGLYSIIAVAWLSTIVSDLVVCKTVGLSPKGIEFKRAHLYDINPVGLGSMTLAAGLALIAYMGYFGSTLAQLYPYVALVSAFVTVPAIALLTRSRYYIARRGADEPPIGSTVECCICEHGFDREDMAGCPVYSGPICSLCCSLDSRCHDTCKNESRFSEQIRVFALAHLPHRIAEWLNTRIAHYLLLLPLVTALVGVVFWLIYFQTTLENPLPGDTLELTLGKLFVIIFIISGIVVWLFVLAQENRKFAEEESRKHTALLMEEIAAHQKTDRQLKLAKDAADSANQAKSRYVVGLSHELRTPLSAILGYAQLLERMPAQPEPVRSAAQTIKRSSEHLAGMIEGLLDISKIEAGKLEIFRWKTALRPFLDQIVDMFTLQAKDNGIDFEFKSLTVLPDYVYTDEKRLRQILINLLSNAIKFTDSGKVALTVSYRNQVAAFQIADSGIGIAAKDLERIFIPFERLEQPSGFQKRQGTGLGLSIARLLVEIMGGELKVKSEPGTGTTFTVRLMLASSGAPDENAKHSRTITGYKGPVRRILVADDDENRRNLIGDALAPLGFALAFAADGKHCLDMFDRQQPDLLLLDISMPRMSGWEVARTIRHEKRGSASILIVSADAGAERLLPENVPLHDAYLTKPFLLEDLFEAIASAIPLEWNYAESTAIQIAPVPPFLRSEIPEPAKLRQLRSLGDMDFARSIEATLKEIEASAPHTSRFCAHMRNLAHSFERDSFLATIEEAEKLHAHG